MSLYLNKISNVELDNQALKFILDISRLNKKDDEAVPEEEKENMVKQICLDNVIPKDKLRKIQRNTLNKLSGFLSATYGPMSSTTQIITGNNKETIQANYSKDGLKVLKHITFDQPLEMAIQSEIENVARFVELQVGDGTTSSVVLSAEIFNQISIIEQEYSNIPPRVLINTFNHVVSEIQDKIKARRRDITIDDIRKICMISTNGNEEVSNQIANIYKEYGFDVSIDVGVSNDHNTKVKIYDGLTVNEGYSDPAYINNITKVSENAINEIRQGDIKDKFIGSADIHDAHVYAFKDPIDTPEMVNFMEKILLHNIFEPAQEQGEMIPTVIMTPHISSDASGLLTKLITLLYSYNKDNMQNQKPPVLVITNISGVDEGIYHDITNLCKCKMIRKYIDPKIQEADQEKGDAPTLDNIHEWYGECQLVSADNMKTKFINPKAILDENDNTYETLLNFLKAELAKAQSENEDIKTIGLLKKRIRCLEANMIEYLVGGISTSDRDALRDLIEDAVKNCSSAAESGVGYAANFEGLRACAELITEMHKSSDATDLKLSIAYAIFTAYHKASSILYGSAINKDDVDIVIAQSLENGAPFNVIDLINADVAKNLLNIPKGENVLCSINTDIEVLDAISRIISLMVTSNQSLVQVPALNRY